MRRAGINAAGHRVHVGIVAFPIGALGAAVIFDVVHLITGGAGWAQAAYLLIGLGVLLGLLAAVFGLFDWLSIPGGTRAKRVGAVHGIGNVVMVGLFALSWLLRRGEIGSPSGWALAASFLGFGLALVTAWLGGELVNRLGIGVYADANPNAPSSLAKESKAHGPSSAIPAAASRA